MGAHTASAPGFTSSFEPPSGSLLSNLQEQHMQQMQQLQMLHQKQLQSVLHHGNSSNTFSGYSGGHSGWYPDGSEQADSGPGTQSYFNQDESQGAQPPPPPPPQASEPQPVPPPPEPPSSKPPEVSAAKEAIKSQPSNVEDDSALPLQVIDTIRCCVM